MSRRDRLRILVVPAWYPSAADPLAGVFVREQAELVAQHHDVAVLAPFAPGRPAGRRLWEAVAADESALTVVRVRRRALPLPKADFALAVAGMRAGLGLLRRGGFVPDVIHAHVFSAAAVARAATWRPAAARTVRRRTAGAATAGTAAGAGTGQAPPIVVTEHYSALARGHVRGTELRVARFGYGGAALLAPVSRNLATRLGELAVRAPVRVIPNAVRTDRFRPPDAGERPAAPPERLLLVGSLVPVKEVPVAIRALAILRATRPAAQLEIIGDGPERDRCERLAHELGVADAVRFAGRLDRDAVAARMRASHVLVAPSAWENLPGAQVEALASGLPIVATRVGGVPDVVDETVGALVDPGDPAALAAALETVLARRDAYDQARLAARAHERFGSAHVAALWDATYRELARRAGGS